MAPEFRGWVLQDIVLAQIAAEDLIGAKQTAESISAARPQSSAFAAACVRIVNALNDRLMFLGRPAGETS